MLKPLPEKAFYKFPTPKFKVGDLVYIQFGRNIVQKLVHGVAVLKGNDVRYVLDKEDYPPALRYQEAELSGTPEGVKLNPNRHYVEEADQERDTAFSPAE